MNIYRYKSKSGGEFVIRSQRPLTPKQLKLLEQDISSTDNILGQPKKGDDDANMDRTFDYTLRCV